MNRQRARLIVLDNADDIATMAAHLIVSLSVDAIKQRGHFAIALSGGSTPRKLHALLANDPFRSAIAWDKILVFWGDERFVPSDHPDSNERMARETLLCHVPIPDENIFAVGTHTPTASQAAAAYAKVLESTLGDACQFDLVLLGLGEDGPPASLFPGQCADFSADARLVKDVVNSPKPPPTRITLTFEMLNRSRNIAFLVSGAQKNRALSGVFERESTVNEFPAKGVQPVAGELFWLIDRPAYSGR